MSTKVLPHVVALVVAVAAAVQQLNQKVVNGSGVVLEMAKNTHRRRARRGLPRPLLRQIMLREL